MPFISVSKDIHGIRSLMEFRPQTGRYLSELAQALLRGPSPLSEGERELIAAYVSSENNCNYCKNSHAAAARWTLGNADIISQVLEDLDNAPVSNKLKALLKLAGKVRISGKEVQLSDIEEARKWKAGDIEIHDTVLIAAAFCMYNRYVDGLNSFTPDDPELYDEMGKRLAEEGYIMNRSDTL